MSTPAPFSHKIRSLFIIIGLAVFLVVSSIAAIIETRAVKTEIAAVMKSAARCGTALIHDSVHQHRYYIEQVIAGLPEGDDAAIRQYFNEELPLLGPEDHYFVLNEHRVVIATSKGEEESFIGIDFSYLAHLKQEFATSKIHQSLVHQNPVVSISYPLKQGRLLLVEKDLFSIAPMLRHLTQAGRLDKMVIFVLDLNGTVVYYPLVELVSSRHNLGFELTDWGAVDSYGLKTYRRDGRQYMSYQEPFIMPEGWVFYAAIPTSEVNRLIGKHLIAESLRFALFFLVLFFVLQFLITRKISQPIKQVAEYLSCFNPMQETMDRQGLPADSIEINQILDAMEKMAANIREAEDSLNREKELLSITLHSIGDGVITTDMDGRVVMLSKVAETLTGWSQEEARDRTLEEIFHIFCETTGDLCENPVKQVLTTGQTVELANGTLLVARDGTKRIIADSSAPIRDQQSRMVGVVLVFRDVTERHLLRSESQKVQKLESLGILAGGIAHDFNNLLTAIWGNISLAKTYTDTNTDIYSYLTDSEKATQMASNLTQQLLTFAKGGEPIRKIASIVEIIKDATDFALHGSNVSYDLMLDEDIWAVNVDPGQMSQVINNLIINADQAMAKGGVITILGSNVEVMPEDDLRLTPGHYVRIAVEDEGEGIGRDILPRIFDPYFTTKETGGGLGLASSYSITKRHGGCLMVASRPGRGTTFYLYMPASDKSIAKDKVVANLTEDKISPTGKGRILVMDDDEMVRNLAGNILEFLGYEASLSMDGEEAIRLYEEAERAGHPFAAVIMDLTIPGGMGGAQAVQEVSRLDPEAKVIVSSGYAHDPIMAEYKKHGFSGILVKPYSIDSMSNILDELLRKNRG